MTDIAARPLAGLAVAILFLVAQAGGSLAGAQGVTYTSPPIEGEVVEEATGRGTGGQAAIAQIFPPPSYSARDIRATVADDETGQTLEGVIVIAQWILFVAGPGGHGPRLHVAEVVTDAHGKFHIPGWGPKPNPRYPFTSLDNEDPLLSFFEPGYRPLTVQNRWDRNDAVRFSEWDGKTIKLQKFPGTPDERARELRLLQGILAWGDVMDWRFMPRITLALELERLKLARKSLRVSSLSPLSALGTTIEGVRRFLEGQE